MRLRFGWVGLRLCPRESDEAALWAELVNCRPRGTGLDRDLEALHYRCM